MANIIATAKQITVLRAELLQQVTRAQEAFKAFDRVMTDDGDFVMFEVVRAETAIIHFHISTREDESLSFHFDLAVDEMYVDGCELMWSFKDLAALLVQLERFVRKVLETVE